MNDNNEVNKSPVMLALIILMFVTVISIILLLFGKKPAEIFTTASEASSHITNIKSSSSKLSSLSSAISSSTNNTYNKYNKDSPVNKVMVSNNLIFSNHLVVDNRSGNGQIVFMWKDKATKVYVKFISPSPLNMEYTKVTCSKDIYNDSIPGRVILTIPKREKKAQKIWYISAYTEGTKSPGLISFFGGSSKTCSKYETLYAK